MRLEDFSTAYQFIKTPLTLIGFVLVVLAGLAARVGGKRGDPLLRRVAVIGFLGLGAVSVAGGLWLSSMPSQGSTSISGIKIENSDHIEVGDRIKLTDSAATAPNNMEAETTRAADARGLDIHDVNISKGRAVAVGRNIDFHGRLERDAAP
jgi:hypothetical protein